jgi:hypothetical protein
MPILSVDSRAGAGGQAPGPEMAGIGHAVLLDNNAPAVRSARLNHPGWGVREAGLYPSPRLGGGAHAGACKGMPGRS